MMTDKEYLEKQEGLMKLQNQKYYRVVDNKFRGFYLYEQIDSKKIGIEYFEISDEEWNNLLNEQSEGKQIILKNGNVVAYKLPNKPLNGINMEFNYDTGKWEETATLDEKKDFWKEKIISLTRESLIYQQAGFPSPEIDKQLEEAKKQYRLLEPTY